MNNIAVSVKDLTVAYGDYIAAENISFELEAGGVAAIIGPNGSGKTSIIRGILGLVPAKSGEVRLFGEKLDKVRGRIGYVPQNFEYDPNFPITVGEFLDLGRKPSCPPERCEEKIKEVGLMPAILKRQLGRLSGGQLQRILVAQAILDNPDLLIMDEPATGIDVVGEATFYDAIRHLNETHNTAILMVSHDLAVVSNFVDQVICVNKKMMCSGPPSKTLTTEVLSEVFGQHASFYGHEGHSNPARGHSHKGHNKK